MKHFALGSSALAVMTCLFGPALADESVAAWRLFVSDHAEPSVHVFDAQSQAEIAQFDISGPASLYRSDSGATVFAVQGAAGVVTAIGSGIRFDDHGDHADIAVSAPQLTGFSVSGESPSHFVEHSGHFAAFFDGEGVARVFSESDALAGRGDIAEVTANAPHHGVVVPFGSHAIVSVYDPAGDGAVAGVQVVDAEGAPVGDVVECVGLHGEALSGDLGAIGGCSDGILLISSERGQPKVALLPFQEGLGQGRVSTLLGGRGLQYFLGNWDADTVSLIDPSDAEPYRLVNLPTRRVHFAVDPVRPRFAYVVTEDGALHQLDVIDGTITRSISLTGLYSMDGHWSEPRPRVAVAGDQVFVTDPLEGKIHVVDAERFAATGEIAVEGTPFNIVAVGGSGVVHAGEANAHAGHDDDAHDHADHAHAHDHDSQIYKGYFEDSQIADRSLADWAGDWQSVYPMLQDGTLDPVMQHKAETGDQSAEDYRAYYEIGYRTDTDRITIAGDSVTFFRVGEPVTARYAADGHEILTYQKGNRGVRFIFEKQEGDAAAPQFIQFSDHAIAPRDADHFHLYWGDDRAALLLELTNWPTYYPAALSAEEVVAEMLAH